MSDVPFFGGPSFGIPLDRSYIGFGDGSETIAGVHYGLVLFPAFRLREAIASIRLVKLEYNGRETDAIHCRELFSGDSRRKGNWAHLNEGQAYKLGESILATAAALDAKFLLSSLPKEHFPQRFRLKGKDGHVDIVHGINTKYLTLWTFFDVVKLLQPSTLMIPKNPLEHKFGPGTPKWRVTVRTNQIGLLVNQLYLDRETTDIPWFSKRLKWGAVANDVVIEGPCGASHLPICTAEPVKHELLEVADLYVWMMGRSFFSSPRLNWEVPAENIFLSTLGPMGGELVLGG